VTGLLALDSMPRPRPTARVYRGTAHLCIADPLGKAVNDREGWLGDLLATHPPIGDRIARLESMAYRRGA
jgi:Zn-dependent protease with chaperone function